MHGRPETASPVVVDRRDGPYGEVVLRRRGKDTEDAAAGAATDDPAIYEIIANGCFLMDTSDGRSERLLVDAALDALGAPAQTDRPALSLLLGGLGVGFSLARAVAEPRWGRITVVEREATIVDWHRDGPLAAFSAYALGDPRVRVVRDDLVTYVHRAADTAADATDAATAATADTYDALCLDIDNGPDWTVTENNGSLYSPSGLTACRELLNPGGVLAVWSARPSAEFEAALRGAEFATVRTIEVPVTRGVPDAVHLAVKACAQAT